LATGSAAIVPSQWLPFRDAFWVLNSLTDLKGMRAQRRDCLDRGETPRWAVVGGGLIGCEVASDLRKAGDQVEIFHLMDRLMERQLSMESSESLLRHLNAMGIQTHLGEKVSRFERTADGRVAIESDRRREIFHGVIVATGFRPRIELAQSAGLKTDRGILTDGYLHTSHESIYAVGDVAQLPDGAIYAFVLPIRNQALWLARHLTTPSQAPWAPPTFKPVVKVHGWKG